MKLVYSLIFFVLLLESCAFYEPLNPIYLEIEPGRLNPTDVTLNIEGLGPCTDNPNRSLHLDSNQPVNVLVHGCRGSSGQFRGLAQVLAFHGQQSACFTYNDRADLTDSATELRHAVDQLADQSHVPRIIVIGHSQGALISRKSLTNLSQKPAPAFLTELDLVTISGPFNGIASAKTCGITWLYPLTLGLLPASCYLITGAKWADITYSSRFILEPGVLTSQVSSYLKIDTDERNSCRRTEEGTCVESDFIFSINEQRNPLLEKDLRSQRVEVKAGHVEIVGDKRVAPTKLIRILQEHGVLLPTTADRQSDFDRLLARVYQDGSLLK